MIFGIGTDIVKTERIRKALEKHGPEFAKKILSAQEFSEFEQDKDQVSFLAKRFAAKEAMSKALGTGFKQGILKTHISVYHDENGRPHISCEGGALQFTKDNQISGIHLTLSDEDDFAVATVVLESV